MKLRIAIILIFLFFSKISLAFTGDNDLAKYVISHHCEMNSTTCLLNFDLTFLGNKAGKTKLILPTEWAGATNLDKGIYDLIVTTPSVDLISEKDELFIKSSPFETINIKYKVKSKIDHPFKPKIFNDFFQFFGNTVFIIPQGSFSKKRNIEIQWNMSKLNNIFNSYGLGNKCQKLNLSFNELFDGIFLGGNVKVNHFKDDGGSTYIVTYPKSDNSLDEVVSLVTKIISSQRKSMQELKVPYYLVSLIDLKNNSTYEGFAATNVTNAFSFIMDDLHKYKLDILKYYIIHEHFHNWIGKKIVSNDNYQSMMWFMEGFNDFCSLWLGYQNGLITLDDYLYAYNQILKYYYTHPLKNISSSIIANDFWKISILEGHPYAKGHIFAHELDYQLRSKNLEMKSVISIIQDVLEKNNLPFEISQKNILTTFNQYTDNKFEKQWTQYFEMGKSIRPSPNLFGKKAILVWEYAEISDYGFSLEDSYRYKIVRNVIKNSPSDLAGLRNDQIIHSIQFPENSYEDLVITVYTSAENTKIIKIHPVLKKIKIPQYKRS